MLQDLQGRLQAFWVAHPRNRIMVMVSAAVITILLLCGVCNIIGSMTSGMVASALSQNPGPKPTAGDSTSQVNNFNPTFPIPSPTTYPYPNPGATPAGSSGTPAPSPTVDPHATPTGHPTHGPGGGNDDVTYTLSPDPDGKSFVSGQSNEIDLEGPKAAVLSVSVYLPGDNSCLNMPATLDANGEGTATCNIPDSLKNTSLNMQIVVVGGRTEQFSNIPVI